MNAKNNEKKKAWEKPSVLTITAKELQKHIKVAARSGVCGGYGR